LGASRTAASAERVALPWDTGGSIFDHLDSSGGGGGSSPRVRRYQGGFESSLAYLRPSIDQREELERPYEENVWIRAALKAFSEALIRMPVVGWTNAMKEQGAAKVLSHPLVTLLNSPNPIQTRAEFWTGHVVNYKLDGECFWFLADAEGQPVPVLGDPGRVSFLSKLPDQIIPVRGKLVEHYSNERGVPVMYRFQMAGVSSSADGNWSEPFPAGAVIPFIDYDPESIIRGLGDAQAVQRETELYFQAQRYLDSSVRNGGNPGAWIVYEQRLAGEERMRRQAEVEDEYTNESAGRMRILDGNAKVIPNPIGPRDMEYRKLLEWLRDSILAAMGVPPPMVGVYDDATYNNINTAERIMWTGPNGVLSLARRAEDVITNKLLRRLNPAGTDVFRFNTDDIEVLQKDNEPQVKLAKDIVAAGIGVSMKRAFELQGAEYPLGQEFADDEQSTREFVSNALQPVEKAYAPEPEEDDDPEDEARIEELIAEYDDEPEVRADDSERLDEVYKKWRASVNMGAKELETWSKNPCSKRASVNSAAVIKRNLHLLRTPKSQWTKKEVASANRTISFISRMRGMPKGKPVVKGCPSKRDISLKNWAYNPSKG
jgi:HK97 family phage portal protein